MYVLVKRCLCECNAYNDICCLSCPITHACVVDFMNCHFPTGWDGLKKHRTVFEQKLPTPEIVSRLHARNLLLDSEYKQITCKRNSPNMNRKLIDFLLCKDDELVKDFDEELSEIHGYNHLVRLL